MEPMTILLAVLLLLGVFAWAGGADSSDSFESQERERRQHWPGFGGDGNYSA